MNRTFYLATQFLVVFLLMLSSCTSTTRIDGERNDIELSQMQVGKWLCDDPTGKSEYTFKADGTWAEKGVYYFDDGNRNVSLGGQWYIKDGYYYQKLEKTNIPDKIAPYDWMKFKIVSINQDENVVVLPSGKLHRHTRIK